MCLCACVLVCVRVCVCVFIKILLKALKCYQNRILMNSLWSTSKTSRLILLLRLLSLSQLILPISIRKYDSTIFISTSGLIHTRHFSTKYCDKKIFLSHRFQYPTTVSSETNVTYLELRAYLGQKKPVAQNDLFIAILCAKILCVTWALKRTIYCFYNRVHNRPPRNSWYICSV